MYKMKLDNQNYYWDQVAETKTFTHPADLILLNTLLNKQSKIIDYGCGYGRTVKQLSDAGFENVIGYDTSKELITRGLKENKLLLNHIDDPADLNLKNESVDCILLFAVLTCIPSNEGQRSLISLLKSKLKKGSLLYISDYYLQESSVEVQHYEYLNGDQNNYGIFNLPEGVTFRHHTKAWMQSLLSDFTILSEKSIAVQTINGNTAQGFQIIARK